MKEQLISFETAELARKKGFNWECRFYYHPDKPKKAYGWFGILDTNSLKFLDDKRTPRPEMSAPTQSLLQKWLRESHNLNVEVTHHGYNKEDEHYSFRCIVKKITKKKTKLVHECKAEIDGDWYIFRTYEDTLENGLRESLKLINKSITQDILKNEL